MPIRILDVGQCGFDGPRMQRRWEEGLDASVDRVPTAAAALDRLGGEEAYDLVLVNRVFDRDGGSGLGLVEEIAGRIDAPPVMLVSDRDDAQEAAVAAGAVRGFGKAALAEPATLDLVKAAAGG